MTAVWKREIGSYYKSITGWLLAAFLLVFAGIYCMVYNLSGYTAKFEYVLAAISFIYLIAVPIISMRSLAEEKRQKTDQLLYSLPIRLSSVVIGKYLAMLTVLALPVLILAAYPVILSQFGTVRYATAYGALAADLGDDEAEALTAYLQGGGSVLLMTDYIEEGTMTNLLKVTQAMGLTAEPGIVIEGNRNMRVSRYPHYILPEIASHEITDALTEGGYYILTPIAQPIAETDGSSAEITWILTTSDESYAKLAGMAMKTTEREDGDTDGPFHVGAVSENGGKLVWFSSGSMLNSNVDYTVGGANSNLVLNALNWMGGQEETISIRAKSMDEATLTVPAASSSFWSAVMIGVIPAVLTAAGIIIYIRRKRR